MGERFISGPRGERDEVCTLLSDMMPRRRAVIWNSLKRYIWLIRRKETRTSLIKTWEIRKKNSKHWQADGLDDLTGLFHLRFARG